MIKEIFSDFHWLIKRKSEICKREKNLRGRDGGADVCSRMRSSISRA